MLEAGVEEVQPMRGQSDALWNFPVALFQIFDQILLVHPGEGCDASQHLVEYASKSPNVDLMRIGLALKDLRSHVKWRAQLGLRQRFFID